MPLGIMGLGELSWAMPSTNFPTMPIATKDVSDIIVGHVISVDAQT